MWSLSVGKCSTKDLNLENKRKKIGCAHEKKQNCTFPMNKSLAWMSEAMQEAYYSVSWARNEKNVMNSIEFSRFNWLSHTTKPTHTFAQSNRTSSAASAAAQTQRKLDTYTLASQTQTTVNTSTHSHSIMPAAAQLWSVTMVVWVASARQHQCVRVFGLSEWRQYSSRKA